MAQYTQHYGLHQWEPGDSFLRTEFNEDLAKIDTALEGKAAQSEVDRKCEIAFGSYTGDGTEDREIVLGFRPKLLLLIRTGVTENSSEKSALLVWEGKPYISTQGGKTMIALTDQGFKVYYGKYPAGVRDQDYMPITNKVDAEFRYLAIR